MFTTLNCNSYPNSGTHSPSLPFVLLSPRNLMVRYKIRNAAHLAGGRIFYWDQWSEIFLQYPLRIALSPRGSSCASGIGSWWDDEANMLCALITVSQFAGVLKLILSLRMMWWYTDPRVHRDTILIAPSGRLWVYPGVSESRVPWLSGATIRLCPALSLLPAGRVSRFCSLKLSHLYLCMSLSDHRPIASLHIVQPLPRLALQQKRDMGLSADCPTSCRLW